MLRKIFLLFFFVSCLFFVLKDQALAISECSFSFNPNTKNSKINPGSVKELTFNNISDNDSNGNQYFAVIIGDATGEFCTPNPNLSDQFGLGCATWVEDKQSGEPLVFRTDTLQDINTLKSGKYTLKLCNAVFGQNTSPATCDDEGFAICKSSLTINNSDGSEPKPPPGDGQGNNQDCRITPDSEDYNMCSQNGAGNSKPRGNCASGYYCQTGGSLGDACISGKCLKGCITSGTCGKSTSVCSNYECRCANDRQEKCSVVKSAITFESPKYRYNTPTPICSEDQVKNKNCQIQTGLGIKINFTGGPGEFIKTLMGILFGVIGGIATILIIFSGYRLMVSQGNPEKIQGAKDQLTAAIIGLLFTIFSLVILQTIGYDILRLPGFGK